MKFITMESKVHTKMVFFTRSPSKLIRIDAGGMIRVPKNHYCLPHYLRESPRRQLFSEVTVAKFIENVWKRAEMDECTLCSHGPHYSRWRNQCTIENL